VNWRWAYAWARVVPFVASLMVLTLVNAVMPGLLLLWIVLCVTVGVLGTRSTLWRRIGRARVPDAAELELVRGALALVPRLRGRGEPRVWMLPGATWLVHMPSRGEVVVSVGWVTAVAQGRARPEALAAAVAAASGRLPATSRTGAAILDAFCAPAWALARLGRGPLRRLPWLRGWISTWMVVLTGIAVVTQTNAGRWPVAVGLVCLNVAMLLGPRWSARWRSAVDRLGEDAVREAGLGAYMVRQHASAGVASPAPLVWPRVAQ